MITIIQQPDSLSFSLNLKKFIVSSEAVVTVTLMMDRVQILEDTYAPGRDNLIEIDLRKIVDSLLTVTVPISGLLQTIDISWGAVCDAISGENPVAWDVWFENQAGERLSYIQRFRLRESTDQENLFVWVNTLGGVDSASFTGCAENDRKLDHKISELFDESFDEYEILKGQEIRQSTGFLTHRESIWLEDFFYSTLRYKVDPDGALKEIVLLNSKVVSTTENDMTEYEFGYRLTSIDKLLNLDCVTSTLPLPFGIDDIMLAELLNSLPTATYRQNLILGVQSPFAPGWMKLPFHELWSSALPGLVDGTSIQFTNSKG